MKPIVMHLKRDIIVVNLKKPFNKEAALYIIQAAVQLNHPETNIKLP